MQVRSFHRNLIYKDGTSQSKRGLPALSPEYARVEERTLEDWISFCQKLSAELAYFDLENEIKGDWRDFLNVDKNQIIAYLKNPDHSVFEPDQINAFSKPHRVLLLSFLQILDSWFKPKLNTFTQTHLDYYYREFLGLLPQDSKSDTVHLWFELSPGKNHILIPAGTELLAGKDRSGKELIYKTNQELVLNKASLDQVKSLFLEKERINLKEAREAKVRVPEEGFIDMLKVVLGSPGPGDNLPAFDFPFETVGDVEAFIGNDIHPYLSFCQDQVHLSFAELRLLVRTKEKIKPADPQLEAALWTSVNQGLLAAGQKRNPNFSLQDLSNPIDFHANFELATGVNPIPPSPVGTPFETFPLIDNVYDLYAEVKLGNVSPALQGLIENDLFFPTVEAFNAMMKQLVNQIRENWLILYALLQQAGESQNPSLDLLTQVPLTYLQNFGQMLVTALPGLENNGSAYNILSNPAIHDLISYELGLNSLSNYFFLISEELQQIFDTYSSNLDPANQNETAWNQVYALMQKAFEIRQQEQTDDARSRFLNKRFGDLLNEGSSHEDAFDEVVLQSLGDPNPGNNLPNEIANIETVSLLEHQEQELYIQENLFLSREQFDYLRQFRSSSPETQLEQAMIILAEAEGAKRGYEDPGEARIERLNHIYAAADAKLVEVSLNVAGEDNNRWRAFGERQLGKPQDERNMERAETGFAFRSPILRMQAGKRNLKFTFTFEAQPFLTTHLQEALDNKPFSFHFSGAEEWYELPLEKTPSPSMRFLGTGDEAQLVLEMLVVLDEQEPAIEPGPVESVGISANEATVKVLLREYAVSDEITEKYKCDYQIFKSLKLETIELEVAVQGIIPSHLQNGQGILDPGKTVEPFGVRARPGASFFIGHPETSFKRLDGLDIHLSWMGIPQADMGSYYANYVESTNGNPPGFSNSSFQAKLNLFDKGSTIQLTASPQSLFDANDAALPHNIHLGFPTNFSSDTNPNPQESISDLIQDIPLQDSYTYTAEPNPKMANRLLDWNRYLELKLEAPGFMDELYPSRASKLAIKLAMQIASQAIDDTTDPAIFEINSPYIPQLDKISLSYRSSAHFNFSNDQISDQDEDEFLHIHAFGYKSVGNVQFGENYFLPQVNQEGSLFLGFKNIEPPQIQSLLFQVAEGSANPELEQLPLKWSYLSKDQWKALDQGLILQDGTHGFTNSGIVRFRLPEDATMNHKLMPAGLYWVSVQLAENIHSVCDMVDIHTQGVTATFFNQANSDDHLLSPLAPSSISKFRKAVTGVKAIHQPYSSFGGKTAEKDDTFYTRVSERLRHKQRALNIWDYEHLVLDRFPEIYKVKCLPADIDSFPDEAGKVNVVVIPDIKGKFPFDPFEPKAPINLLNEIERYLRDISPPFSNIKVQNPAYIQLKLRFAVKFHEGKDTGFYSNQLEEEVKEYLAPWAYEKGAEIEFGGKIYPNSLVNFIDEREYVDYMAGIQIFSSEDGSNFFPVKADPEDGGITNQTPGAIWVSARKHEIDLIKDKTFENRSFEGIGHMQIELDFQLD